MQICTSIPLTHEIWHAYISRTSRYESIESSLTSLSSIETELRLLKIVRKIAIPIQGSYCNNSNIPILVSFCQTIRSMSF